MCRCCQGKVKPRETWWRLHSVDICDDVRLQSIGQTKSNFSAGFLKIWCDELYVRYTRQEAIEEVPGWPYFMGKAQGH
jgi:hypothetical protein